MKISFEIVGIGYANIVIERDDGKKWGASLPPGADLNVPLLCMWEGDAEFTPVHLSDETKASIAAKRAELEV